MSDHDIPADPYAEVRHLDGQVVTSRNIELRENADGDPWGVTVTKYGPAVLHLPRCTPTIRMRNEHRTDTRTRHRNRAGP